MKVFISHSGDDKWVARQISRLVEAEGHKTFLDEKDIKSGDSIDASIQSHLKDCDHVVLLLSPSSITSHWVFIEVGGARALGKRVVPILLHLGANEIPSAISQFLARDKNELDRYLDEIRIETAGLKAGTKGPTRKVAKKAAAKAAREAGGEGGTKERQPRDMMVGGAFGGLSVGDTVRVVEVERLTDDDKAKSPKWVRGMDKYSGVVSRVVGFDPYGGERVVLEADDGAYWWSRSWVSKVE